MNEEEMILRKKIEKREKVDTIIAYVLLVVLLACIFIVLYLKFIRKEDTPEEEYKPNYISLNEISNSLNTSTLASNYQNDGANFNSSVLDNSIVITYNKENTILNLNVPLISSELKIDIDGENADIKKEIYKEIASIICVYYGNNANSCKNTLDNVNSENSVSGIRFTNEDNINNVYVNTTKSFNLLGTIYNEVTKVSINSANYTLNLMNTKISNIKIYNDEKLVFGGDIERLNDDTSNVSVLVKLYDKEDNFLAENKYEFNNDNSLEDKKTFEVSFILSDTLKMENISKYSIEIIK